MILFIRPPDAGSFRTDYSKTESLGVEYLCAILKKNGICCDYVDYEFTTFDPTKFSNILRQTQPDIVGFSINYPHALNSLREILDIINRELPSCVILVGGQHVSMDPERFLTNYPDVQYILRFEAEQSIVPCIKALSQALPISSVPNLIYRENGVIVHGPKGGRVFDLDRLPIPDRPNYILDILRQEKRSAAISASRGCWWGKCRYCTIGLSYASHQWVSRDPVSIADEIERSILCNGIKDIIFVDAEFLGPPKDSTERANAFTSTITSRGIDISYSINLRPENATENNINILKESGLSLVYIGVESAAAAHLKRWRRGTSPKVIMDAVEILNKSGVPFRAGFIMFDPFSTLKDLEQNINFLIKYPVIEPSLLVKGFLVRNGLPFEEMFTKEMSRHEVYDQYFFDPRTARFVHFIRKSVGKSILFIHRLRELWQKKMLDSEALQYAEHAALSHALLLLKRELSLFQNKSFDWLDTNSDVMIENFIKETDSFITNRLIPDMESHLPDKEFKYG